MPEGIDDAVVIGAGMMGPGIAACLAVGGLKTTLLSRKEESARQGLENARSVADFLGKEGLVAADIAASARERLAGSADFDASITAADIVVESAVEDMEFKRNLFTRLDSISRPDAILASNTSGLSISAIAANCKHPERILTTHFWNPPHLIPLVEVVMGEKTSPDVVQTVMDVLKASTKTPVLVKKDTPGQLGNRLQMALVREAIHIVQEGIADADAVDTAAKTGFGMRLPVYGIFEHQDLVGLETCSAVLDYVSRDLSDTKGLPPLVKQMIERGEMGAKAGKGYYDWSKKDADAVKSRRDRFIVAFLKGGY